MFAGHKETHRVTATVASNSGLLNGAQGSSVSGYEIHMGQTSGEETDKPFRVLDRTDVPVTAAGRYDGAMDSRGQVLGTYIHGLFHNGPLRMSILHELARQKGVSLPEASRELVLDQEYDKLASWVRGSLNMDLIYQISGLSHDFEQPVGRV